MESVERKGKKLQKSVKKENLLLAKLNYHVKLLNKTQQKIEAVKTVLC